MEVHVRRKQCVVLAAAAALAAGIASAQPSLLEPNNSAGSVMDTPPLVTERPATSTTETPSRTDSSLWAFDKLDPAHRGYVTQSDVAQLPGQWSFYEADRNRDGRLDAEEFQRFWADYQSGTN